METIKLEFKDVAGYMPYGILGKSRGGSVQPITLGIRQSNSTISIILDEELKPILRPISDMNKTIIHNGKQIVPIVELAIIAYGNPKLNYERKRKLVRILSSNRTFKYIGGQFITLNEDGKQRVSQHNSYKLFDYLHELKIDYRGLIDEGLAVDVNTLSTNPYK